MLRSIAAILAAALLPTATAGAATISVTPDQLIYFLGETVTLTITGDDEGASALGVFGSLLYSGLHVDNVSRAQTTLVGENGTWRPFILSSEDDGTNAYSWAFNQISPDTGVPVQPDTANNLPGVLATVTLHAVVPGVVDVTWDPEDFDFFGLTSAPGTAFCIESPDPDSGVFCDGFVPEPATGALVGFGLLALAWTRRRA